MNSQDVELTPLKKTASGIFLPSSSSSQPPNEATVLAVGPGAPNRDGKVVETSVKAGDKVLLPAFGGQTLKVGEDEYALFRDSEILAKLSE